MALPPDAQLRNERLHNRDVFEQLGKRLADHGDTLGADCAALAAQAVTFELLSGRSGECSGD
jgi:hypothetical protein